MANEEVIEEEGAPEVVVEAEAEATKGKQNMSNWPLIQIGVEEYERVAEDSAMRSHKEREEDAHQEAEEVAEEEEEAVKASSRRDCQRIQPRLTRFWTTSWWNGKPVKEWTWTLSKT